jgi:hypothetical protein
MSRNSRLHHPAGGVFIQVQQWAVKSVGFAQAAVLGLLDFLDSAQDSPGQPLATRQRIIAELEGLVGRNNVDKALDELAARGWVTKIERQAVQRNIVYWYDFALNPEKINEDLEAGIPGFPKSGRRVSPNRDRNGNPNRGAIKNKDVDHDVDKPPPSDNIEKQGGGGFLDITSKPKTFTTAKQKIALFLQVAGAAGALVAHRGADLERVIGNADDEQINIAGALLAGYIQSGKACDIEALAITFCRKAAVGKLVKPAAGAAQDERTLTAQRQTLDGKIFRARKTGHLHKIVGPLRYITGPDGVPSRHVAQVDQDFLNAVADGRLVELAA